MSYLTIKEVSEKWGISERRIMKLCQEDRVEGAIKNGGVWSIPEDTKKPLDKRSKISNYVNIQRKVLVANLNTEIGEQLLPLLEKEGYIVEGICEENSKINTRKLKSIKIFKTDFENRAKLEKMLNKTEKYYDGLIFIDAEKSSEVLVKNKEWLVIQLVQKMDVESSVVLVNNWQNAKMKLETKLAKKSKERNGVRINSLNLEIPNNTKVMVDFAEIAKDVCTLFTNFKNTSGVAVTTNGGCLSFDEKGRTANLETGIFYCAIHFCFKNLNKQSHVWCASMMLEDEWTEEPLEMNFRVMNLEVANRGVNFERIFIFPKSEIKKFRDNKTLQIYMQSNMKTMFVDYYEILEKEPELLKIVGNGWDGINQDTLIVDLPEESKQRGYISQNKKEVKKAYQYFEKLKSYAQDLKEVLR